MAAKKRIVITSRVYIPVSMVSEQAVAKHYTVSLYKEETCDKCPIRPDRHTEQCDVCPAYEGEISTWRKKTMSNGKTWFALPPGNPRRLEALLHVDLSQADDRRPIVPFKHKIKFTGKLHDGTVIAGRKTVDQVAIVKKWLKEKGGIISAPPRSGKSVMACAIICQLGVRTIIIAHNVDLLRQIYKTFMGSKREHKPAMSNLPELEKKLGRKLIGIVEKPEDLKGLEIALVNYQKFIRATGPKRIKKYLNGKYSCVFVDEVHQGAALAYARFIARLDCRYRGGLSATWTRKDGKSVIIRDFIGRIVARAETTAMVPEIELLETGVQTNYNYRSWVGAMKYLAVNYTRNKLIVREVFKDLRAGHKAIIIPMDYREPIQDLVNLINRQAKLNFERKGEDWAEELAIPFYAGVKREQVLHSIETGKSRVLIAMRSMIKQGIDMTAPSMLYCVVPMSANMRAGAPMFEQLSYRPCTWAPNKRQPIVKVFIDGLGQSSGCWKSLFWKEIFPKLKRQGKRPAKYKMKTADYERGLTIAKMRDYSPLNAPGERKTSAEIIALSKPKTGSKGLTRLRRR